MSRVKFVQGNEACAEGALAAGCRFFAGYPITPSSEVAEVLSRRLPEIGGRFVQMEDEIASIAAIIGASLAGAKAMTATSGPGFSLMQENLGFACLTEIPIVVVNVMRGGPSTGMPTAPGQADLMQARWGTHGDHPAIALAPSSVGELFHETVRAFNLAERFRTPVTVLTDEVVAHTRERLELPEPGELELVERRRPEVPPAEYLPYDTGFGDVPPMAAFGDGYRFHVTGLVHAEDGFPTNEPAVIDAKERRIHRKLDAAREAIDRVDRYQLDDAEVALVAICSTARAARRAIREVREAGHKVGLFRPLTLWPFPDAQLQELAGQVHRIVVAEMNLGQLAGEVRRAIGDAAEIQSLTRVDGEPISPAQLADALREAAR